MKSSSSLSRRERQIMDIVYAAEGATVAEVQRQLPEPPTDMAVRRMMHILEEKGMLKRSKRGREFVYKARQTKKRAGLQALQHVLDTFFEGAVDQALAAHLTKRQSTTDPEQLERMLRLIEETQKEGR